MDTEKGRSSDWSLTKISCSASLGEAISSMKLSGFNICCILSKEGKLGIITDGDIRRALLDGASIKDSVNSWVNFNPKTCRINSSSDEISNIHRKYRVREIPILSPDGMLAGIFTKTSDGSVRNISSILPNAMFIMAGGLGERLNSVINDRPKPLAEVGGKPILQTIILRACASGIRKFYVSVNHMADKIERHLNQNIYSGLDIEIVREDSKLGTAGPIGLVKESFGHPLLVCNADILTTVEFDKLIYEHENENAHITCAVREHEIKVPFGVLKIKGSLVKEIQEKPVQRYHVNAGIYVLSDSICKMIPYNKLFDMPSLVDLALSRGLKVSPFLIHEYWLDIGHPEDFTLANREYSTHFE